MSNPEGNCRFLLADGFHVCGSYARNETPDPDLCDMHYYYTLAREAGEALTRLETDSQCNEYGDSECPDCGGIEEYKVIRHKIDCPLEAILTKLRAAGIIEEGRE